MPVQFSIDPTPNPNSMKITVASTLSSGAARTYRSAEEAAKDEFAQGLFAIPGVRSVFVLKNFATVTKEPAADWGALLPKLHDAVERHFQGK